MLKSNTWNNDRQHRASFIFSYNFGTKDCLPKNMTVLIARYFFFCIFFNFCILCEIRYTLLFVSNMTNWHAHLQLYCQPLVWKLRWTRIFKSSLHTNRLKRRNFVFEKKWKQNWICNYWLPSLPLEIVHYFWKACIELDVFSSKYFNVMSECGLILLDMYLIFC